MDGEDTTEESFLGTFVLLTDGSLDTARNLISGGMLLLFGHPEQRAVLAADLDRTLPAAVEEMLRVLSPVTYIRRVATRRIELGGEVIEPGDRVAVFLGSGNHDEEVFDRPEIFDVTRDPNPHIAFGAGGPHFCVGSHLGRAEGLAALREMLRRLPDIDAAGTPHWAPTSLTSGLESLPARFTPTARRN